MRIRLITLLIMLSSILKLIGCINPSKNKGAVSGKDSIKAILQKSIDSFMNRPIHKVMAVGIIDSASDEQLLQVVFDNLSEKFSDDYTKEFEVVSTFSRGRRAIYVIWLLEAEVNNGGFNQFYSNPSGQFARLIPEALKMVGALKISNLVNRANDVYQRDYEKITKYQDGSIEGFSKSYKDNPLNDLDDVFYALCKEENLYQLQVDFIRTHKQDFVD